VPVCSRLLVIAAAVLFPALANAHAILEDSSPAAGTSVPSGARDLQFRYNSRIDAERSRLTLTKPDHTQMKVPIELGAPPDILRCHLDLVPGAYTIRWQVLAVDGHITRGDVPFTVTGP
jgi:copper resistance protein C